MAAKKKIEKPARKTKKPARPRDFDFGDGPFVVTHPRINFGIPVVGRMVGTFSTRITEASELIVESVDAHLVLPPLPVVINAQREPIYLAANAIPATLAELELPPELRSLFGELNRGTIDWRAHRYRTTLAMALEFPALPGELLRPTPAVLLSLGTVVRNNAFFSAGLGTILAGSFAGAMFCCGHGAKPLPPPTPPPPPPPVPNDGWAAIVSNLAIGKPQPPPIKPGDIIDGRRVLDTSCGIRTSIKTGTVGYTETTVICSGCAGACTIVRFPMQPLMPNPTWSIVGPSKPGGNTIKRFDGQPGYYHACVCFV